MNKNVTSHSSDYVTIAAQLIITMLPTPYFLSAGKFYLLPYVIEVLTADMR